MRDIRLNGAIPDGSTDCITAIHAALAIDDIIIQNGEFLISESIKIPSGRTVYGLNAKVKLASGVYDNVFRNSDFVNGNTNVNIVGLRGFCIEYSSVNNNDDYATYTGVNSNKYVAISLFKTDTFKIENIHINDFPHHCVNINKSTHGNVENLSFNINTVTANQDGIDIMWGCHDVDISKIRYLRIADDALIFFAGLTGNMLADYSEGFNVGDIYNINVDDIVAINTNYGRLPSICIGNGNKLHDIEISDMKLISTGAMLFSNYGTDYSGTAPDPEDVYNILIDTVEVNTIVTDAAVCVFGQSMSNSAFTNITNNSGKPLHSIVTGTISEVYINEVLVE